MRTQLDSIISRYEVVEEGRESEHSLCPVGDLNSLKKKPVRNIIINSGCCVSVLEVVEALRSAIYTENFQHSNLLEQGH